MLCEYHNEKLTLHIVASIIEACNENYTDSQMRVTIILEREKENYA